MKTNDTARVNSEAIPEQQVSALRGATKDSAVVDAIRDLDEDIHGLVYMARILGNLLDDDLVTYEDARKYSKMPSDQSMTVHLTDTQLECLSFAWNDVVARAERLRIKFEAACGAGATA